MQTYLRELTRPWKIVTLLIGISVLLYGAKVEGAPDWDWPISFIMATTAYLTAPAAIRAFKSFTLKGLLLGVALVWFGSDGNYWLYWSIVNPQALALMREANAPASALMFLLCGFLWLPQASLLDGLRSISAALGLRPRV
jgi:hypothetical protein